MGLGQGQPGGLAFRLLVARPRLSGAACHHPESLPGRPPLRAEQTATLTAVSATDLVGQCLGLHLPLCLWASTDLAASEIPAQAFPSSADGCASFEVASRLSRNLSLGSATSSWQMLPIRTE